MSSGKKSYAPDPRPTKRKKDKKVMADLHAKGVFCVLCDEPGSLHHLLSRGARSGDDVAANLIPLCGHGSAGHHGLYHNSDERTRRDLGAYVLMERPDTLDYVYTKMGEEAGAEWLRTHLFI